MSDKSTLRYKIFTPYYYTEDFFNSVCEAFEMDEDDLDFNSSLNLHTRISDLNLNFLSEDIIEDDEDEIALEIKEYLKNQLNGAWSYFRAIDADDTILINVLHHLKMCRSIVNVNINLKKQDISEKEKKDIFNEITLLTKHLKGLLCPTVGVLISDDGLVLDQDGNSDFEVYMPPKMPINEEFKSQNEFGVNLRNKTLDYCFYNETYVMTYLPLLENKEEYMQSHENVCKRAIALLTVALLAECRLGEKMSYTEAMDFVSDKILSNFDATSYMSDEELSYFRNENSTEQDSIQYSWQYENLAVMLFALSLFDDEINDIEDDEDIEFKDIMPYPSSIAPVALCVRKIHTCKSLDEFIKRTKLKDYKTLMQNADIAYELHWACVDARIIGFNSDDVISTIEGVAQERHKSFFWICGIDGEKNWDNVELST